MSVTPIPRNEPAREAPGCRAYVALGANLGDRARALRGAVALLGEHPDVDVLRTSPVYEAEAHTITPGEVQPPFLNAVVEVATRLAPEGLLALCLDVEQRLGRRRTGTPRWAPRPIDLDLLVFGAVTYRAPHLLVPHPRMAERRFVLQPLFDLAPDLYVPAPFEATVAELLARCPDPSRPVRTDRRLSKVGGGG